MEPSIVWGSLCFGAVIGWITYHTMRKNTKPQALADLTVIIAALVGPGILTVFPGPVTDTRQTMFGYYGIGLAFGFFLYYIVYLVLAWAAPAEVLLSMGLVQQRDTGSEEPIDAAEAQGLRQNGDAVGQGRDEPFIELG